MADPIGALRATLSMDSAQFQDGLKRAQSGMQKFGAIAKKGAMVAGAAMSVAAVGIAASMRTTLNAADELSKSALAIGIPIEELSRLKYAADLSGLSFQQLETGVSRLSRNMNDALQGVGEGAEAFETLGISVAGSDGKLKSSSDIMREIADRFAAMPDGAEKTALAMDLLGRAGADMIPLLNGGSQALGELMAEADTFGAVFSEQMGKDAELFNDNISRLKGTFAAMSATITAEALPTLVQFSEWLVENGPAIATFVGQAITGFGDLVAAISPYIAQIVDGAGMVVSAVLEIGQMFAGIPERVRQDVDSIKALVGGLKDYFVSLPDVFKQIGIDMIAGLWAGMQERWRAMLEGFKGLVNYLPSFAKELLGIQSPSKVFAEIGAQIVEGLSVGMAGAADGATTPLSDFADSARSEFATLFRDVLTGAADFGDALRATLANVLGNVGGNIIDAGIGGLLGATGIPGFASGTRFAPGGLAVVGERGPELVNLPRGSQVIPNHRLGGGGGVNVTFAPVVDARGADVAAVARLESALRKQSAEFGPRVVEAVRAAQRARAL